MQGEDQIVIKSRLMMNNIQTKNWLKLGPWFALFLSAGLWIGALGFEHIGGMHPCQMCYWQRHAHKAVLVIAVLAILVRALTKSGKWDRIFLTLIGLAFLVSFGLAFWHAGVEYKWWEGPKTCSATLSITDITPADISKIFEPGVKLPSCSDAPWHMFGISMAGYNALISAAAAIISLGVALRGKNHG